MGRVREWLARRVGEPLVRELKQGSTPEGLATSVAVGSTVGILPFLGMTTMACAVAGFALRLNHVGIQVANLVTYPVQVAMLVPFVRLGEGLTGSEPLPLDPSVIASRFAESPSAFLAEFGIAGLHGLLGWMLVAPLAGWAIRASLLPVFRRLSPPKP